MDKTKFYIDLSNCTEEERKHIKTLTGIKNDSERIYLSFSPIQNVWGYFDSIGIKNKTELTYPEFIKLFEGGESKEVLQVENNEWIKAIAISHQKQMSSTHPHAIIGTIEDAIIEALETLKSNQ